MDYWKGPHSGIISATPGLEEYRQIHLAEDNPGCWPATDGVETAIPADRKIDGVAEVTFQSALSPLKGRTQTQLAFKDEINVFRRTLLYAGPPNTSRWYDVAGPARHVGARALVYLRRRDGVGAGEFRKVVKNELVPRTRRHRRAEGAAHADVPALEREALGHPERRPRQPGRPALPRLAHPRVRRTGRPDAFFTSAEIERTVQTRWHPLASRSTPTTSPPP